MQNIFKGKRFHYIICLFIVAATLIVYSNTFHSGFHFDDTNQIVENYKLKDLKNLSEILMGRRGVTMVTFALNYAVSGLNVVGHHIVNTIIVITQYLVESPPHPNPLPSGERGLSFLFASSPHWGED